MIYLKVLDGQYVVGGGGACSNSSSFNPAGENPATIEVLNNQYVVGGGNAKQTRSVTKGRILNGAFWVDDVGGDDCDCNSISCCNQFKKWYNDNIYDWQSIFYNQGCNEVISLDINYRNFSKIPNSICSLTRLSNIFIFNNEILSDIKALSKVLSLRYIILQNNNENGGYIDFLPIAEFPLITFMISGYNIGYVPEYLFNINTLTSFEMSYCNIDSIPSSVVNLSYNEGFSILNFDGNNLTELPENIGEMDNDTTYFSFLDNNFTDDYKDHIRNDLFPIANSLVTNGYPHLRV